MTVVIDEYDVWKLQLPLGRTVSDNNCHYSSIGVVAVCLKTDQGPVGWGYGECCWKGVFTKPAWYIRPMESLSDICRELEKVWWPELNAYDIATAWRARQRLHSKSAYLDAALRMALWDLMAKEADLPLYRFLGGSVDTNRVRAYGSLLDYTLTDEQAVMLAQDFVSRGFQAIKVKVGSPDVGRDIQRLRAVRAAIGDGVELTMDANTAWTPEEAIARIRRFQDEDFHLGYLEDPLPPDDVAGFARISREADLPIVGHDYISAPQQLRELLQVGGVQRIRNGKDTDFTLACADLAKEFAVPMIFGNSLFEFNVHAAAALPEVDRLEFSNLAWNDLLQTPVQFESGYGIAPERPGHGLEPSIEALQEYSCPEADTAIT